MDLDEKSKFSCRTGEMDVDESYHKRKFSENNKLVKKIGKVVRDLRSLGFTSLTEDAYASAIFLLLKAKVHDLAGDDYRSSVLQSIKEWIQAVPLQFLYALLAYLGDSVSYDSPSSGLKSPLASCPSRFPGIETPSEGLVRWQLRLEYFAYETLQDLRIAKLFEIIVDYPDSSPAIEDLKQCLEYTGQHSKLIDSFISALRYRLLTAGASTNDILHQYVSTIKALRTIDPTGVFLEAVGEPLRDYLRGRKDTVKCIVTMLTDGTGGNPNGTGNPGDSLLEELNRDEENQENAGCDDDINTDDKQAWINAERWEPDPVEADPLKGSRNRRKIDVLGMIVGIIGSKDQLVNEYRVMLAEKLLNKSDYDIDSEIRTLELLKAGAEQGETGVSLDLLDATIISSNFWPPIQDESLNIPGSVDQLLSDYAKRFHEIKTPRKLLWKKNLGSVKLELQFEDRAVQFTVAPVHAAIIMQFQDQTSWTSKNLAVAIGIPEDALNRRINFWISKGILAESLGADSDDHIYTLVDGMVDTSRNGVNNGSCEELLAGDEEGERSVASVEEQLLKEMTIYEKFILGMLTNFGSMALDRIHNTLKMFCVADPPYDKSLQQLQSFLSGLVSEEKLELRDGISKATELLLREEWKESVQIYSQFISLCQEKLSNTHDNSDPDRLSKLQKSLCLALSNRAEARSRLREFSDALEDCDQALKLESTHFKTLLCKGKILINLNRYSMALGCFKRALLDPQSNGNSETLNGYLDRCKKLEFQSRNGAFDLSDWVLNRFQGKPPELAEYIGAVQIKKSENGGRGFFATKNTEAGTLLLVTKAVATDRGILPEPDEDSSESARLVMWKDFIDKVLDAAAKCTRTHNLICALSTGEDEEGLEVPDISLFRPETEESIFSKEKKKPNTGRILSILDVNSLTEDAISAKVLGKNSDYYGVGLWILASFINHSCNPNARRLHIGDHVVIHASRDVKAGEEITFAYFDVLLPLNKRQEMSKTWGFNCNCKRCKFEEEIGSRREIKEIEMVLERASDMGGGIVRLEEGMRRWMVKGKEKGYLRASFWAAFSEAFKSEKSMRRWGRRIPAVEAVTESIAEAVGGDERVLKVVVEGVKKSGAGLMEMERAMKLGRGVYGKVVKKQAMRALLELGLHD
ncbi:hypothetical protein HHK36_015374 [Tetracentron sinense]|uniref:Anaphase-promoting complex subunit 2 n=1 Tax=Tetracentron sinense TaxID=13715 RepID=A0A834Z501_TETSI|nr:hypothetical protein HHK36_015374 [Tetracentron sinense]